MPLSKTDHVAAPGNTFTTISSSLSEDSANLFCTRKKNLQKSLSSDVCVVYSPTASPT